MQAISPPSSAASARPTTTTQRSARPATAAQLRLRAGLAHTHPATKPTATGDKEGTKERGKDGIAHPGAPI